MKNNESNNSILSIKDGNPVNFSKIDTPFQTRDNSSNGGEPPMDKDKYVTHEELELSNEKILHRMDNQFAELRQDLNKEFRNIDQRFNDVDRHFNDVDKRFEQVNTKFEKQKVWFYGTGIAIVSFTVAILSFLIPYLTK